MKGECLLWQGINGCLQQDAVHTKDVGTPLSSVHCSLGGLGAYVRVCFKIAGLLYNPFSLSGTRRIFPFCLQAVLHFLKAEAAKTLPVPLQLLMESRHAELAPPGSLRLSRDNLRL